VNILGQHQSDLSARFTGKQMNRFEGLALAFSFPPPAFSCDIDCY
jgi:hypothetical protein